MYYYVGIDPGFKGGIVLLDDLANLLSWWDTPIVDMKVKNKTKTEYNTTAMRNILVEVKRNEPSQSIMVFLEKSSARPGQGVTSSHHTGFGSGLWVGLLVGLQIPYTIVHPKSWTKVVLFDVPAGDPKQRSFLKTQQLFPTLPLTKPKGRTLSMDGRSDAALLAYYGYLQHTGNKNV